MLINLPLWKPPLECGYMDNPAGYPHTHILNSNILRILIDCKSKGRRGRAGGHDLCIRELLEKHKVIPG